jgi:hypothetical protein
MGIAETWVYSVTGDIPLGTTLWCKIQENIVIYMISWYNGMEWMNIIKWHVSYPILCCILSFWWFSGAWNLCRRFETLGSIFLGCVSKKNKWNEIAKVCVCVYIYIYMYIYIYTGKGLAQNCLNHKIQTLGNQPKERIQQSEHGESLKSTVLCSWSEGDCRSRKQRIATLTGIVRWYTLK